MTEKNTYYGLSLTEVADQFDEVIKKVTKERNKVYKTMEQEEGESYDKYKKMDKKELDQISNAIRKGNIKEARFILQDMDSSLKDSVIDNSLRSRSVLKVLDLLDDFDE